MWRLGISKLGLWFGLQVLVADTHQGDSKKWELEHLAHTGIETLGCLSLWVKSHLRILLIPDFYFKLLLEKTWLLREWVAEQSCLHLWEAEATLFPADTEIKLLQLETLCQVGSVVSVSFQWTNAQQFPVVSSGNQGLENMHMLWSCQEICSHHIRTPVCWGSKLATGTVVVFRSKETLATLTAFTSTKFIHASRKGAGDCIVTTEWKWLHRHEELPAFACIKRVCGVSYDYSVKTLISWSQRLCYSCAFWRQDINFHCKSWPALILC